MQYVFVFDRNKQPLMPCQPARARELLKAGKAAVYRRYPFTIILMERAGGDTQPVEVKLDPGSQTTGVAVVVEGQRGKRVVCASEISHRGAVVKDHLDQRRNARRSRRSRHTRYWAARFRNRQRSEGWLPPSLVSRVQNNVTWVQRLSRLCPVSKVSMELVKFDTQIMQNPENSGVEYQQGTLTGYEVREYLLDKWDRCCAYCGKTDTPLEVEHIHPRSRGGSDRVSNLTLACHDCNQRKGAQTAAEFGHPQVQAQAKLPLKDAAAVNTTRWALHCRLCETGLPVEVGTGGRTKFNRVTQGYAKAHWIDAACVGRSGAAVYIAPTHLPLIIQATGRGSRQMCRVDQFGFPRTAAKAAHRVHGFQTGDLVQAVVPSGKKLGTHQGRVAVRTSGSFNITTHAGTIQGISHRHCTLVQRVDGYTYSPSQKGARRIPPQI
ncbi:MAG: RNA-guided endonuclease IscB [Chloroflexota bacterium]